MPDLNDRMKFAPHVVSRRVAEETVILDLESGNYFGLDPVGTRFLELLEAQGTISAAMPVMLEEFEVAPEQLEADLVRLCGEMLAGGLLVRE